MNTEIKKTLDNYLFLQEKLKLESDKIYHFIELHRTSIKTREFLKYTYEKDENIITVELDYEWGEEITYNGKGIIDYTPDSLSWQYIVAKLLVGDLDGIEFEEE